MKARSIVFDLFGDYLRYRGGEVRLRTLISLLACFDVGESTARVVMARLRKEGWFETRAVGRETVYTLTTESWQTLDEGRGRIFERNREAWDGGWHMVIYTVPETSRELRETLRKQLTWLGFGPLASSTWISSRNQLERVAERFGDQPGLRLDLFTSHSGSLERDRELVDRCWDLESLGKDYVSFLRQYRSVPPIDTLTPQQALVSRTQLIHEYRKFPFRDPDLPVELLPASWPGATAHELFLKIHRELGPLANQAVDHILAGSVGRPVVGG